MLIKFSIFNDGKYWCARGIDADIFTQGKTLDELHKNIKESVELYFEEYVARGEKIQIIAIWEIDIPTAASVARS